MKRCIVFRSTDFGNQCFIFLRLSIIQNIKQYLQNSASCRLNITRFQLFGYFITHDGGIYVNIEPATNFLEQSNHIKQKLNLCFGNSFKND